MEILLNGEIGVEITAKAIADNLLKIEENDKEIKLLIDSPGGAADEQYKIIELLQNYKSKGFEIITENAGDVMSAAVGIFLSGNKRIYNENKGVIYVHNPWVYTYGDADYLEFTADYLKYEEEKILNIYSELTGIDKDIWRVYLDEDRALTTDEIIKLNVANEIIKAETKPEIILNKAKAYINKLNNKIMEGKLKKIEEMLKQLVQKVKTAAKQIVLIDTQGNELDFGDSITDESQIVIGVSATVNGAPANGQYTLEQLNGGSVLTFENGVLVDIQPMSSQNNTQNQTDSSQSVEEVIEQVVLVQKMQEKIINEQATEIKALRKELAQIKAKFNAVNFVQTPEDVEPKKIKKSFNI